MGRGLEWVPRVVREAGYGAVARVRYKVFGRYAVCPMPTAAERDRFVGFEDVGE